MSTATLEKQDAKELPDWITSDTLYEIIDGEYVEKEPMSAAAEFIANIIVRLLNQACLANHGQAFNEMLLALPGLSNKLRPDAFYVSYEKWPNGKLPPLEGPWEILPDICIEVISPSDDFENVLQKKNEYFEAGVKQVWIVSPKTKLVLIFTGRTESRSYGSPAVIDCSAVIPGFTFNLADVL